MATIKPLTILIGLNEKLFQPEDTYLDKGTFQYDNQNNITNAPGTPTGELHRGRLSLIHLTHL